MILIQCDGCGVVKPARILSDETVLPPNGWLRRGVEHSELSKGMEVQACNAACLAEARARVRTALSIGARSLDPLPLLSVDFSENRSMSPRKLHQFPQNGQEAPIPTIALVESLNLAEQPAQVQEVEETSVLTMGSDLSGAGSVSGAPVSEDTTPNGKIQEGGEK